MKPISIALLLAVLTSFSVFGQNITLQGKITSQQTNEPLAGVNIIIKSKKTGTISNKEGTFKLEAEKNDILIFSATNMKTIEETVNGRSEINVSLEETIQIPYQTVTKNAFTGSAQVIESSAFEGRPADSFARALQGQVAGLRTTSTGQAGGEVQMQIRGASTLYGDNQPLLIVDDAPFVGELSDINPSDIETVSILKDASATALYGGRAGNGVIIINTKQDSGKGFHTSFNSQWSSTAPISKGYELMNTKEYYEYNWQKLYYKGMYLGEGGLSLSSEDAKVYATENIKELVGYNPFAEENPFNENGNIRSDATLKTDTDWKDLAYKTGMTQNYNLNVGFKHQGLSIYSSIGYTQNEGVIQSSDFERLTGKVNIAYTGKKGFEVKVNTLFANTEKHFIPNQVLEQLDDMRPIYPMYLADGRYNNGHRDSEQGGFGIFEYNPIKYLYENTYEHTQSNILINGMIGIPISENFKFKINTSLSKRKKDNLEVISSYNQNIYKESQDLDYETKYYSLRLYFNKQIDKHHINAFIGTETTKQNINTIELNEVIRSGINDSNPIQKGTIHKTIGAPLLSNFTYNYNNTLNLTVNYKSNTHSFFSDENRFNHSYSLGTGWVISNEEWMPKTDWLTFLKLQASYGKTANSSNNNLSYNPYHPFMDTYAQPFYWMEGHYSFYPNNDLTPHPSSYDSRLDWEKHTYLNMGLKLIAFKRLTANIEYYTHNSDKLLRKIDIPAGANFIDVIFTNEGSMENSGIELSLEYNTLKTKNWNYTIGLNTVYNTNKLEPEGHPAYSFYLKEWAGVNPYNGESLWYTNEDSDDILDIFNSDKEILSFKDPLGSGRMVTNQYLDAKIVNLGSALPDVYGGFYNAIRYKSFDLNLYFSFSLGGKVYNATLAESHLSKGRLNHWTFENKYTDTPRPISRNDYELSSRFLEDASYLRLKNISFGYNLPNSICKSAGMRNAKIYISAENLWTATKYTGADIESVSLNGLTNYNMPNVKSYMMGIKVDF